MARSPKNQHDNYSEDEEGEVIPNLSPARLIEGVRDTLLSWYKQAHLQKPWPQMSEKDQKIWINRIEARAEKLVMQVVDHVATGDFPVVHAKIDAFQIKAGEVKITAKGYADDEVLLTLNHAGPKAVKIIVADSEQFDQERDPLNPDPDQPGLPGVKMESGFEEETPDPKPAAEEPPIENPDGEQEEGDAVLTPKSAEWRGGYNSRMGGHLRNENPFSPASQIEQFNDWFAGWDAAQDNPDAPALGEGTTGEVERTAEQATEPDARPSKHYIEGLQARAAGADALANPYVRNPMKQDWAEGWDAGDEPEQPQDQGGPVREPDIEPESEEPEPTHEPDAGLEDDITDHEGVVIESDEQAFGYGQWCRKDGRGTGSNPFPAGSDFFKAWLRGYNEAKKSEAKDLDSF